MWYANNQRLELSNKYIDSCLYKTHNFILKRWSLCHGADNRGLPTILTVIPLSMYGKDSVTMSTIHKFITIHITIIYCPLYSDMACFYSE